ncbi:hypothetical protein Trydic_g584 [Trypoxylus dichotomus]
MQVNIEQRYAIKHCIKLKKTPSETLKMIRTEYTEMLRCRQYKFSGDGRETIEDDCHYECPSPSKTDKSEKKACSILARGRRLTRRLTTYEVGMNYCSMNCDKGARHA